MAIRLRRPLALASVVTATLAGAVLFRALTSGGGEAAPPAAVPTETKVVAASVSPSPPTAAAPLTEETAFLRKKTFSASEAVTVKDGIGFLAAADGSLETWSWPDAGGKYYGLSATPDSALLLFNEGKEGSADFVIERSTGRTWRLGPGIRPLSGAAHGMLLMVSSQQGRSTTLGVLNILESALTPVDLQYAGGIPLISPDGRKVAVQSASTVSLVDLPTARAQKVAEGLVQDTDQLQALPGALGFVIARPGQPAARWFSWEGVESPGGMGIGEVSPNGKYLASGWSPGPIKATGSGGFPTVDAVVIYERQSRLPVAQYLSATAGGWTSGSDALVVQVSAGYRLVTPAGQTVTTIDDPIHVLDPRPSPTIAGLLGTNRGTIINTVRNQTIAPQYAEQPWRAAWSLRPGELVVQLSTPGKGRSWPDEVLPFEARTGTIQAEPSIVVKAGGDCLNLRERPDPSAPVVRCLADGTMATFEATDDPSPDPKASGEPPRKVAGFEAADLSVWFHLKLADGASGWADSKYLGWAK